MKTEVHKSRGAIGVHWGGGRGLWMDFRRAASDLLTIGKRLYLVSSVSRQNCVKIASKSRQNIGRNEVALCVRARVGEEFGFEIACSRGFWSLPNGNSTAVLLYRLSRQSSLRDIE